MLKEKLECLFVIIKSVHAIPDCGLPFDISELSELPHLSSLRINQESICASIWIDEDLKAPVLNGRAWLCEYVGQ